MSTLSSRRAYRWCQATPPPSPICGLPSSDRPPAQSRHGSAESYIPNIRPRTAQHARAHHRLHVPPRSPLWVCFRSLLSFAPPTHPFACTCSAENCDDPEERFIRVLQYYLAGWHIKPKGVKKPCVRALCTCIVLTLTSDLVARAQVQPHTRRVLPLSIRLPRWLARFLYRRTR